MGMDIQNNAMPINATTWMTNINCLVDTNDKKKMTKKDRNLNYICYQTNGTCNLKIFLQRKFQSHKCSLIRSIKHLKKKLYKSYTNRFRIKKKKSKNKKQIFFNLFHETTLTLILKPDQEITSKNTNNYYRCTPVYPFDTFTNR